MKNLTERLARTLHHKRLGDSTAAIAGFASALSVVVGVIAAHAAPRGWSRITVALRVSKAPLIVKLAPIVAGIAVIFAAAAGLLKFYAWCVERQDDEPRRN